MENQRPPVLTAEFKGHRLLVLPLPTDSKGKEHGFRFGRQKAEAIIKYLPEIQEFVASFHKTQEEQPCPAPDATDIQLPK
jgi:hypothetical protein